MNHVSESLPEYGVRVLFYKPNDGNGWGKEWLIGHRSGTNSKGDYWLSEKHFGYLFDVTHWQEMPALPGYES